MRTPACLPSAGAYVKILVVEDDPKVGEVLEMALREEAFEVERTADGRQALLLAVAGTYDLILLDYMLPGKSGPEVAAELRRAGRRVPILMLTARDGPEDLQRALASGVSEVMGKPFHLGELLDRINALVSAAADET